MGLPANRAPRAEVLFDVRRATWYPEVGLSRYARGLLGALLARATAEIGIVPVDLSDSGNWEHQRAFRVGRAHGVGARVWQEQVRLAARTRQADLIHLPWYEGPVRPACPLVVSIHDLDTVVHPERYPRRFRVYYNTLLRAYIRRARRIIVSSRASLAALEDRWPGRPYVQIYLGVDPIFAPSSNSAAPDGPPTILYSGGWGKRKRVGMLIEAFMSVAASDPDVRLVMVGDPGPDERELMARTGSQRMLLPGRVSDERLAELYRDATVVAYPSALEGFGFPVVEGFASGTPVVAARAGSIPEVAGDAALLFDDGAEALAEALRSVLGSSRLQLDLRERGLRRARDFSWETTAERTLAVYRDVLAE